MDLRLPLLADANLHLGVAEEALAENSYLTARREWEKAAVALDELRAERPQGGKEEGLFQAMFTPLEERFQKIARSLPQEKVIQELSKEEKEALAAVEAEKETEALLQEEQKSRARDKD